MDDIRAFSGKPCDSFKNDFIRLLEKEKVGSNFFLNLINPQTFDVLAISGGAANGAYGAGLLCGWTEAGTRPIFKVVTGISTGAIMAPVAFLGSKYDGKLREFYTRFSTKDIVRIRNPLFGALFGNSLVSTRPLEHIIESYFDADFLKQVAIEYNKGRRLYVGTTNLDAQRLVIWDMGKIASIGGENALKLFRKIIIASASMPIAFPPVYLNVEINEEKYDEMHVDGGVTRQVFFLYDVLQGLENALKEKSLDVSRIRYAIYVIRNGYVDPQYEEVPDRFAAISERAIDTTINAQSIGDLYQLYVFTKEGRGDFNLAYIPGMRKSKAKELFDPVDMQELFDLGYEEASVGYHWRKAPPGFGVDEDD
jgi:hypothetical protein